MGLLSNKIDREHLNPGDHIYSWRLGYSYAHHGIYVGLGMVIHFTRAASEGSGSTTMLNLFSSSSPSFHATEVPCPRCGDQARGDGVIASCLECILFGGHLYLFKYDVSKAFFLAQVRGGTCTLASSDSAFKVLRRAFFLLEKGFGDYHVFKNNCMHFAIYCKTGLRVNEFINGEGSEQAASCFAAASTVVSVTPLPLTSFGALPISCGVYCARILANVIGIHKEGKTD